MRTQVAALVVVMLALLLPILSAVALLIVGALDAARSKDSAFWGQIFALSPGAGSRPGRSGSAW